MSFEAGERRAAALLREVPAPVPFDAAEFCRRLAAYRGRPIVLVAQERGELPEAVGLYIDHRDRDEIHYEVGTSDYHQQAIILHEVGHLVAEHHSGSDPFPAVLLAGDWDPDVVRRIKMRHRYDTAEEREAEGFATAVLDHVNLRPVRQPSSELAGAEQQRLESMFLA